MAREQAARKGEGSERFKQEGEEKEASILEKSPTSDQREKESDREPVDSTPES